jgi:integrase
MQNRSGRRFEGAKLYLRNAKHKGGRRWWVILDRDAHGKRREVSTGASEPDRAKAEKAFADHLAKKHQPNFGGGRPDQVLVSEVLAYYGERKAAKAIRKDTIAISLVKLGEFFKDNTVHDISPSRCEAYTEWRIRQGDRRSADKGKSRLLKRSTARYDLSILKAAIGFCYSERKLSQNIPVKLPERSEARPRFLTRQEAAWLLAGALGWDRQGKRHHKSINRHLARFIVTGLGTGTRHDRVLRLQWVENLRGGWVDLDKGILHRKAAREPETKKKAPSVPMPDRLWSHMRRWRKLTARYVIEHSGSNVERGVHTAFKTACELAGLSTDPDDPNKVTPHTLRHTCVTWMLDAGISPWKVGRYVGMTAEMVERVYGHTNDEMQRETANAVRRNRSGSVPQVSHTTARKGVNGRERA